MSLFNGHATSTSSVSPLWLTGSIYGVDHLVLHGTSLYSCLIAHTAGTFATDLAALKWQIIGDGVGSGSVDIKDEGSVVVSAASAINFVGAGVTATSAGGGVATVTIPGGGGSAFVPAAFYGDGSDGSVTLDGSVTPSWSTRVGNTYTLLRSIYCVNLTLNTNISIKTAGYFIYGTGTLTINSNALIHHSAESNGLVGVGGSGGLGGDGPLNNPSGYLTASEVNFPFATGANGTDSDFGGFGVGYDAGANFGSGNAIWNINSGDAGAGGSGTAGAGGNGLATFAQGQAQVNKLLNNLIIYAGGSVTGLAIQQGGAGGASGAGDGVSNRGGAGGGGGSGGGVVGIWFYTFNNLSVIRANGSNGGPGENRGTGNVGGGGGGGGGAGGTIYLVYHVLTALGTLQVNGGSGGAAGTGNGTGTNGTAGTAGDAGVAITFCTAV